MYSSILYHSNNINVHDFYSTQLTYIFHNFIVVKEHLYSSILQYSNNIYAPAFDIIKEHVYSLILYYSSNMHIPATYITQLINWCIRAHCTRRIRKHLYSRTLYHSRNKWLAVPIFHHSDLFNLTFMLR